MKKKMKKAAGLAAVVAAAAMMLAGCGGGQTAPAETTAKAGTESSQTSEDTAGTADGAKEDGDKYYIACGAPFT